MDMDPKKLPRRALIDTGVLIRALDKSMTDKDVPACRDFWEAMLNHDRRILISAPTMAEFLRKPRPVTDLPREKQVEFLAFDVPTALILGQQFPSDVLKKLTSDGTTVTHLKYDAMIVACGLRWKADCLVHLDSDFEKLCHAVKIDAKKPELFRASQLDLPHV